MSNTAPTTNPPEVSIEGREFEQVSFPDDLPKILYEGNCHCGAVAFKVHQEPLYPFEHQGVVYFVPVGVCNCSICFRNGYLVFHPQISDVEWLRGRDDMKVYRMAKEQWDHLFCGTCGSHVCIDYRGNWKLGAGMIGMNVRMYRGIEYQKLNLRHRDGRNRWPEFNDKYH